ncbi:unnamed protein product [Linum tenue]|uniref:Uncharacterized protein n=1 Tax=Linum tenue TaxID=586396 RepID=A0AAV0QJS8_9ROSI|nr:unnamed protein product [Linum tenue]
MHSGDQNCHHPCQAVQEGEHQAVPQLQDQVPIGVQEGEAPDQEAEDDLQGIQAQLVCVGILIAFGECE